MSFCLRILEGKNQGEEYNLTDGENLVGRSRSSHIRVYNDDVSGKHFILEITSHGAVLHNISAYGTKIDGMEVQKDADIHPGQVISAGKTLKLLFAEFNDKEEEQQAVNEMTNVTKFVSDVQGEGSETEDEVTSVTKFASDNAKGTVTEKSTDDSDMTSVTKFVDKTEIGALFHNDAGSEEDVTQATKFISNLPAADKTDKQNDPEKTQTISVEDAEKIDSEKTQAIPVNDSETHGDFGKDGLEKTQSIPADDAKKKNNFERTQAIPVDNTGKKQALERTQSIPTTSQTSSDDKTSFEESKKTDEKNSDTLNPSSTSVTSSQEAIDATSVTNSSVLEEQGMFFEDENDESEKTNANETQIVQTRMASMDEMNFIKNQIKKQQQGKRFLYFLFFVMLFVFLGIVWMMKAPQKEQVLSWPHVTKGNDVEYLTTNLDTWGDGYKGGTFDLYYPAWKESFVEKGADKIIIHSFLGINGDVPLEIILHREEALSHVYESRENALTSVLKKLSEKTDEMFNFEGSSVKTFFIPAYGPAGNGIPCDVITYQKDSKRSWFGILRFFRHGKYNYTLRVEVPAAEKHRALPILTTDDFLTFHPQFVKSHWEGDDEYIRGDADRMIMGVKDELVNHNSPMQYPRLELTIKSILAQAQYNGNKQQKQYDEGMDLLLLLREKQQQWYNGQRIRWVSAERENNRTEKIKIRNESEAVFSISGDKRRFDILRDYWE